jgi:gliding motility-associated protein GldM
MAHERLSPRQKMIGMMYLVLTAMLALNVSKEAVKAFMKVEEGLNKTVKNYEAKNKVIYDMFEAKAAENIKRGGPARDKAFYVKGRADELFNYIQNLKIEIIKVADGEKAVAINGKELDIYKVLRYDDTNIPSQILIGAKEDGRAFALRAAINDYRDSLIAILGNKNLPMVESLRASLSTADGKKEDKAGTPEAWPNNQFQTLPVVAVIALLSKIQVDVRNAETDVITTIYEEIDKRSFKFNRLLPTVTTNSTYVMAGNEYEASIFFAAVDTTQRPKVFVGDYTINGINPDGSPKYEMVGTNYQTLDYDESGRGVYKIRPTGIGQKEYHGLITMTAPDLSVIARPFKGYYEVGAQNVVVAPTAMNILYRGIENPMDVSVPGVGPDKVKVSMKYGKINKGQVKNFKTGEIFPGTYVALPSTDQGSPITDQVMVTAEINGKQVPLKPVEFRIKDLPTPVGEFAGVTGQGDKTLADILLAPGCLAVYKDFDFNIQATVTEFTLSFDERGLTVGANSKSNRITDEQKALLKRLTRNAKLYVQDILAIGPDKKVRSLSPIIIKVK